jgi:predicted N-acyltransferase
LYAYAIPNLLRLTVHDRIASLPEPQWDALLDAAATPFVRWAWLEALEHAGCVSDETGWGPRHLALWDGERLVAAAPAYLKDGSDGDFSRDWGWAEAAARAGIDYYPKLILAVPFTPVTGRRLLVAPGFDRATAAAAIAAGAREVASVERSPSVHVLFPDADDAALFESVGLARRVAFQYHWRNDGYRSPDDFLARFDSKRRNQQKRERAAPAQQGIAIRTVRGDEIAADPRTYAHAMFELHRHTVDKMMWGRRWLNRAFYERVFARMPGPLEVVEARRDGKLVAGAFNLATPTHLYGRYWGCFEDYRFLHFNVCLYHSIDECIQRGVRVFEGGAGGEHKLARGFEPAETYSNHVFLDERLEKPLRAYIAREADERAAALARWRAESPILKHR